MSIQSIERKLILRSFDSREMLRGERTCEFLQHVKFVSGKDAYWCRISPTIIVQNALGWQPDCSHVLLTARFEGDSILEIGKFPFFVFLAILKCPIGANQRVVTTEDVDLNMNAELYET